MLIVLPAEAADSDGTGSQAWYGWCVWTLSLFETRAWISLSTSPLITASFLPNLGTHRPKSIIQISLHAYFGQYYSGKGKWLHSYRVSRALRLLLRGCCSRQLTAGLPAVGRVMALSTRLVIACTANTFNWVRSKSSYRWKDTLRKMRQTETGNRGL